MSQSGLLPPQDARVVCQRGLPVLGVRAAVAPHVEHEEVEVRPASDPTVHTVRLRAATGQRRELEHGALRPGGEEPRALDRVPVVLEHALVEPVVRHLVVVPLDVLRGLRVESPHVLVHQVVAVVAAILLERLRDLRLGLGHEVLPGAAPGEIDLGLEGAVGVDHVAAVDEEVRLEAAHHLVEAHAAPRGVDPPALPGGVAGPHERHVAAVHGRRPEAPDHGRAGRLHVAEVEERHPVEDVLARGQAGERHLRGIACLRQRRGAHDAARVLEALGGGVFDEHAGRAVRRAPHDRPLGGDLAGLHAEGQGRARRPSGKPRGGARHPAATRALPVARAPPRNRRRLGE